MKHILSIFCLLFCLTVKAQYSVSSPDMKVWVTLKTKTTRNLDTKMTHPTKMKVDVSVKGKTVIEGQEIGLTILSHGHRYSFGKANVTAANVSPEPLTITTENDGELAALGDKCKRLLINTDRGIVLEVLVFDAGIARDCSAIYDGIGPHVGGRGHIRLTAHEAAPVCMLAVTARI